MSYEIVKGIRTKDGEVFIKSDSNNVFPKTFEWWKAPTLSKILQEGGREALDKEMLLQYYKGNFQKTDNNYEKSVFFRDRSKIHWDCPLSDEEIKEILYIDYVKFKRREFGKFILSSTHSHAYPIVYVTRKTARNLHLTGEKNRAKVFKSKEDAEYYLSHFDFSKYSIEKI